MLRGNVVAENQPRVITGTSAGCRGLFTCGSWMLMISVSNVTLAFGKRVLFKNASIKFSPGNCYGLIGANGSGKSTFLKILSGELEPNEGSVASNPGERIATLRQDQFAPISP